MEINKILKPCPFCGKEVAAAEIEMDQVGAISIEVHCSCGAVVWIDSDDRVYSWDGTAHQTGLTAIEKWNRRAER